MGCLKKTQYASDSSPLRMSDIVLLFNSGVFESAAVNEMITNAKKTYVADHHSQAITQLHSKNKYKDGNWKTYVNVDGNRKEVVRKTEEELYEYLYQFYKDSERTVVTFEDAFLLLVSRKQDELDRCYNTIADDKRYFSYIDEKLKKKPLVEITEADLRRWLVKGYLPTKPKETALRKMLQLIKQVFSYARSQKLCVDNPAEFILFDDYAKNCDHNKKADEERAFSEAECDALRKDALSHIDNPRCLMRLLSMYTGMRVGELSALLCTDVQEDFIHVHRQQVRDISSGHQVFLDVEYTKDERRHPHGGRYIPRTPEVNQVLELTKKLPGTSQYVFHDKEGNPITKDSYELHLRRSCRRLGIKTTNNHAFRIAFNSKLIERDLSSADRALILGHAVQTNEQRYSVSDKRRLESIRQRIV